MANHKRTVSCSQQLSISPASLLKQIKRPSDKDLVFRRVKEGQKVTTTKNDERCRIIMYILFIFMYSTENKWNNSCHYEATYFCLIFFFHFEGYHFFYSVFTNFRLVLICRAVCLWCGKSTFFSSSNAVSSLPRFNPYSLFFSSLYFLLFSLDQSPKN